MTSLKDLKKLKIRDDLELDESQIPGQVKQSGFQTVSKDSFTKFGREAIKGLQMQNVDHIQKEAVLAKELSELIGGKEVICPRCGNGTLTFKVYSKASGDWVNITCNEYNPNLPQGSCKYSKVLKFNDWKKEFKEKKL